jgi:hypothetical protein
MRRKPPPAPPKEGREESLTLALSLHWSPFGKRRGKRKKLNEIL